MVSKITRFFRRIKCRSNEEKTYNKYVVTYAEHDPHIENRRIQYAFKGKREHVVTLNTPNIAYACQNFKIEIPKGSSDTIIVRNTLQCLTFNLEIESKDKNCGVVQ